VKKYLVGLSVLLISLMLAQCERGGQNKTEQSVEQKIDYASVEVVKDRLAAIKKCGSCHSDVYENWMKGPHANAYKAIRAHIEHADTSSNFSDTYRLYLNEQADLNVRCYPCHTGSNVWETNFAGLSTEADPAHYTDEFYPKINKSIGQRDQEDPENMLTGVDCLSCHKDGDHVVTHGSYKPTSNEKVEGQCNPIASPFFSTNQSCRSCHIVQVRSMKRLVAEGHIEKEVSCNSSCHQEYDDNGKGTHYYFWRHEAEGKVRPKDHHVFENITTEVVQKDGEWVLNFAWSNNYIPHDFSACGEAIVVTEVWSKSGAILAELTERANLKDEWLARDTAASLRDGIAGYHFLLNDAPLTNRVILKGDPSGGTIRIRGLIKPQYWSKEGELEEQYSSDRPVIIQNN